MAASDGRFHRAETSFRNWITPDGAPGPSGEGGFAAEPGRYHLYVAWACPWAHRTLIFRTLKKLAPLIGVSFVETVLGDEGWTFSERRPDDLGGRQRLYEVYAAARSDYTGRASVPVLWDKEAQHDRLERIVRDHPHVQFGLRRRRRRRVPRLLSEAAPRRDRPAQRCSSMRP